MYIEIYSFFVHKFLFIVGGVGYKFGCRCVKGEEIRRRHCRQLSSSSSSSTSLIFPPQSNYIQVLHSTPIYIVAGFTWPIVKQGRPRHTQFFFLIVYKLSYIHHNKLPFVWLHLIFPLIFLCIYISVLYFLMYPWSSLFSSYNLL